MIFYFGKNKNNLDFIFSIITKNKILTILVVGGLIVQLLPVGGSGLKYEDGIRFYGINGTDGIMHLAYIEGIVKNMPPSEPGAYPAPLKNYHYWSDLIIGDFARVWHLPVIHLFFQFAYTILIFKVRCFFIEPAINYYHLCCVALFSGGTTIMPSHIAVQNTFIFASYISAKYGLSQCRQSALLFQNRLLQHIS